MTTLEAYERILKAIKERFTMNGHRHTVSDISDLKQVAKTGRYSDLSGTPNIPSVEIAKQNKLGLVMPGKGVTVDVNGSLSLNVDSGCGLYIDDNLLKIRLDEVSSIAKIELGNWIEMLGKISAIIEDYKNKNIFDFKITLRNTSTSKTIVLNIDKNKIDNFTEISEFVFETLDNSETFPRDDSDFIKKDGYSTDYDDFKHCELYKLLASTDVIDIVELFLYKELLSRLDEDVVGKIGKRLPDVVKVHDDYERITTLGFISPVNETNNIDITYILSGNTYVPLMSVVNGSVTPTPTPEPDESEDSEPPTPVQHYTISEVSGIENPMVVEHSLIVVSDENGILKANVSGGNFTIQLFQYGNEEDKLIDTVSTEEGYELDLSSYEVGEYVVKLLTSGTEARYNVNKI